MDLSSIAHLKKGTKIRCKLNNGSESRKWFTGTIRREPFYTDTKTLQFTMNRDDFGSDSSWNVIAHIDNSHLVKLFDFEWNEAEN